MATQAVEQAPGALWDRIRRLQGDAPVILAACCKTCRKGKACGDSCISATKSCSKPPGCACNG